MACSTSATLEALQESEDCSICMQSIISKGIYSVSHSRLDFSSFPTLGYFFHRNMLKMVSDGCEDCFGT